MRQVIRLAVFVMVLAVGRAGAQSVDAEPPLASAARSAAAVVQPAPGGGEMVILGPESHYVTRAWRNHDRNMHGGCTRENAAVAERARTAERP